MSRIINNLFIILEDLIIGLNKKIGLSTVNSRRYWVAKCRLLKPNKKVVSFFKTRIKHNKKKHPLNITLEELPDNYNESD